MEINGDNVVISFVDDSGKTTEIVGFSEEEAIAIPWYHIIKDNGESTIFECKIVNDNRLATINLYNNSDGYKEIINSDRYGKSILEINNGN